VVEDKKDELVGEPKKPPLRRVCDRAKHCMQVLSQHPISGEDKNDVLETQKADLSDAIQLFPFVVASFSLCASPEHILSKSAYP
jgi:hypothetical protein